MAGPGGSGDPAAGTTREATPQVADALERQGGPGRDRAAADVGGWVAGVLAVSPGVAAPPTPPLDDPLRRLSNAANHSVLWLAIAAALGTMGGPAGRRAAVRGAIAIGVTSPLVNL